RREGAEERRPGRRADEAGCRREAAPGRGLRQGRYRGARQGQPRQADGALDVGARAGRPCRHPRPQGHAAGAEVEGRGDHARRIMTETKAHDTPPEGPPVRFETRDAGGGRRVGIAWLARPRRLNALDLDMCELLLAQLGAWAVDDAVAAVVVAGDGPKGFCAGGDVSRMAREIRQGGPDACAYGDRFFTVEYQLDYLMHAYAKPLVTWAHGVTMGGGLGLSVAGSNRIVTTGSRIAMPEIHIGLFPDVGGGWFLNRVPGEAGILLALSGVTLNEQDAVFA